jgi:hypothetical protein
MYVLAVGSYFLIITDSNACELGSLGAILFHRHSRKMAPKIALCITGFLRTFYHREVEQNIMDFALNLTSPDDIYALVSSGKGDTLKGMESSPPTSTYLRQTIRNWFEFNGSYATPNTRSRLHMCYSILKQREIFEKFLYDWIVTIRPDVVYQKLPISRLQSLNSTNIYLSDNSGDFMGMLPRMYLDDMQKNGQKNILFVAVALFAATRAQNCCSNSV